MTSQEAEARQKLAMMAEIEKNELTVIGSKQGVLVRRAQEITQIIRKGEVEKNSIQDEILTTAAKIKALKEEIKKCQDEFAEGEQRREKDLALIEKAKDDFG